MNEDLLVSSFGVEYGIDIVVFAGNDDGEFARNPNIKRDWGDAFWSEKIETQRERSTFKSTC